MREVNQSNEWDREQTASASDVFGILRDEEAPIQQARREELDGGFLPVPSTTYDRLKRRSLLSLLTFGIFE